MNTKFGPLFAYTAAQYSAACYFIDQDEKQPEEARKSHLEEFSAHIEELQATTTTEGVIYSNELLEMEDQLNEEQLLAYMVAKHHLSTGAQLRMIVTGITVII